MNSNIFSENLKKFRLAKGLTQEQAADALHVNAQTVSRWECGTTMPDVMLLPEIAKLYGVTVDDLFRKQSLVYDNYAQRLSAVYEKTRDPEDFILCRLEYLKLMKEGELSTVDKWNYATIHHFMFRHCLNTALDWYDKAIADDPDRDPHTHRRARSLRGQLMFEIGRGKEFIADQQAKCALAPDDPNEWIHLIEAHIWAREYEEAYAIFLQAIEKFPGNWVLHILGGDVCNFLKKYDEAFTHWTKAGELGTDFYDELYCMAACWANMGEYEKARRAYLDIAEKLRRDHYDEEAEMAEASAKEMQLKAQAL